MPPSHDRLGGIFFMYHLHGPMMTTISSCGIMDKN